MSDKPDVAALIARLRRMREHGGQDYACMDDAAAALQSQAEKVAELEQQRMAASSLWAQNATRADTAEARVQELEDAVRGWEACLVRANEERDIFKAERDALRADAVPREPEDATSGASH